MTRQRSITRSLVVTVLLLEALSAIALIGAVTIHEKEIRFDALDANLVSSAQSLMAGVQESGAPGNGVAIDPALVRPTHHAVIRVQDEHGNVLGSAGPEVEPVATAPGRPGFRELTLDGHHYRLVTLRGIRVIDPGQPDGGVRHEITITYGMPLGRVWHEIFDAVRFVGFATLLLLGTTAAVMIAMLRRKLAPIGELAGEARRISSNDWHFDPPASARETAELRPLVTALEETLARLKRVFEQQRRFTSDAAHELKTDLAIVKSSLQLLSMKPRSAEEYSRGLATGLNDFERLETTLHRMLTLARLEQAKDDLPKVSCDLSSALEEAIEQALPLAELKSIKLVLSAETAVTVPVHRHDALLLCSNLLSNALGHSVAGGRVEASTGADGNFATMTIRDQGEGIAPEDIAHLFEPFYRGDPSRSRKSGGTGLGLAISRAICERAGGMISIANNPDRGACVIVSLPVAPHAEEIDREGVEHSASLKAQQ